MNHQAICCLLLQVPRPVQCIFSRRAWRMTERYHHGPQVCGLRLPKVFASRAAPDISLMLIRLVASQACHLVRSCHSWPLESALRCCRHGSGRLIDTFSFWKYSVPRADRSLRVLSTCNQCQSGSAYRVMHRIF